MPNSAGNCEHVRAEPVANRARRQALAGKICYTNWVMHLNELYSRHQIALMRAAAAGHDRERHIHEEQADQLASQIASIQHAKGVNAVELLPAASI